MDHRLSGESRGYLETFDEGYYAVDPAGNVDIVLRRVVESGNAPAQPITQVIHLRTVWHSVPGRTIADETQINGTVHYFILTGRAGAAFEGAGSIFYTPHRRGKWITGSVDQASLLPTRRLAAGPDLFQRAEIHGRFRAVRDPRRAKTLIHEMNRRFGPRPLR